MNTISFLINRHCRRENIVSLWDSSLYQHWDRFGESSCNVQQGIHFYIRTEVVLVVWTAILKLKYQNDLSADTELNSIYSCNAQLKHQNDLSVDTELKSMMRHSFYFFSERLYITERMELMLKRLGSLYSICGNCIRFTTCRGWIDIILMDVIIRIYNPRNTIFKLKHSIWSD